jgi:hypothetical protein
MVRFVYQRICIQCRVAPNPVDEVVDHGSDAIDATKSRIKEGLLLTAFLNLFVPE